MRYSNGITASFKMVDTCAAEFEASTLTIIPALMERMKQSRQIHLRKYWYLVQALSVSVRVSSSITAPFMQPGLLPKQAMRQLSLTTTRRQ